jgi:hypothetical protein
MNFREHFGRSSGWAHRASALLLVAASSFSVHHLAPAAQNHSHRVSASANPSMPGDAPAAAWQSHFEVKRYFLDFAGDHSLNGATVTEQSSVGYANYTVQLRLASGAEQSVDLVAPPGGLQIEMQDMTGDHVPNDVILRPALPRWPPTVLVNDGHDHFAVVESSMVAGFFSSRENLDSRRSDGQTFAYLRSSGFKAFHLPSSKRTLAPALQQSLLSPFNQSFARRMEDASSSGRAPPFFLAV